MRFAKDTDSKSMRVTGQGTARIAPAGAGIRLDDGGFIMVAMLVGIAVAAVWMAAALPAWRHQMQREKEAELIFRGEAIARAIYLYRQKTGQALPPSLDVLVSRKFLRKKYIDPITGKDFQTVAGATQSPGGQTFGAMQAGMIGVRSSSPDQSIRVYNGQQLYSQWVFDFSLEQQRSGGGPPTGGGGAGPITPPGARGGRGGVGPGGRPGGQGGRGGRGGIVQPGAGPSTRGGRGL